MAGNTYLVSTGMHLDWTGLGTLRMGWDGIYLKLSKAIELSAKTQFGEQGLVQAATVPFPSSLCQIGED